MKRESKCILPLQYLVEIRVEGLTHRFKVSRHYPSMDYEFTCLSENPTMKYSGLKIPYLKVKEAKDKGLINIIY